MADTTINTIRSFLHQSGAKYRVFDMGRRVVKISADQFIAFENANKPYPYPLQRTAHFGIIFWNPAVAEQHYIWFLKFPLDEQGLLVQATRDEFLVMLLDRVGECMLAAADGKMMEGALKDSPYTFKPSEDKMAAFNAQASYSLGLKASAYYDDALAYFTGTSDVNDWHKLGKQGVADVATRLDDLEETLGLIETIPKLPDEPFIVLSTFLENAKPAAGLVEVLAQRVDVELQEKSPNNARICACLRAASNSDARGLVNRMVVAVLKHKCSNNIEVLATISGRIWRVLAEDHICMMFVERLATNDRGYQGFSHLLADVMYMPDLRDHIMNALRSPKRTEQLARRVGTLFGQEKLA